MSTFDVFPLINPNLFDDSDVITLKLLSKFHSSIFNYDYIDFYRQSILFNHYMLINIKFVFTNVYYGIIPDFSDTDTPHFLSDDLNWNKYYNISQAFNWNYSINDMLPLINNENNFSPGNKKIWSSSLYINNKEINDFYPHIPLNKLFSWNYLPFLSDDNCLHIFIILQNVIKQKRKESGNDSDHEDNESYPAYHSDDDSSYHIENCNCIYCYYNNRYHTDDDYYY